MQHNLRVGTGGLAGIAHGFDSGVEQSGVADPIRRPGLPLPIFTAHHFLIGLIADLDHVRHQAFAGELCKGVKGELIDGGRQTFCGWNVFPSLWDPLLVAIGPIVGIVKVQQDVLSARFGPTHRPANIVKSAVFRPVWIIPEAQTQQIMAGVGKQLVGVNALAALAIDRAAIFHLIHIRQVRAKVERWVALLCGRGCQTCTNKPACAQKAQHRGQRTAPRKSHAPTP